MLNAIVVVVVVAAPITTVVIGFAVVFVFSSENLLLLRFSEIKFEIRMNCKCNSAL